MPAILPINTDVSLMNVTFPKGTNVTKKGNIMKSGKPNPIVKDKDKKIEKGKGIGSGPNKSNKPKNINVK